MPAVPPSRKGYTFVGWVVGLTTDIRSKRAFSSSRFEKTSHQYYRHSAT
ncbi:hypothetical protein [Spirosoma oryzae]